MTKQKLRRIRLHKMNKIIDKQTVVFVRTIMGQGWFHEFGIGYEELGDNVGQVTTAIVELEDGTIHNVKVGMVEFMEVPNE